MFHVYSSARSAVLKVQCFLLRAAGFSDCLSDYLSDCLTLQALDGTAVRLEAGGTLSRERFKRSK